MPRVPDKVRPRKGERTQRTSIVPSALNWVTYAMPPSLRCSESNGVALHQGGVGREGVDRDGVDRGDVGLDGVGHDGVGRDGVGHDGVGCDGVGRDGAVREGIGRDGIGRDDGVGRDGVGRDGGVTPGPASARRAASAALVATRCGMVVLLFLNKSSVIGLSQSCSAGDLVPTMGNT